MCKRISQLSVAILNHKAYLKQLRQWNKEEAIWDYTQPQGIRPYFIRRNEEYDMGDKCPSNIFLCIYVYRVKNAFLRSPTPRLHCFLSSHWPSFRILSFMAFFIPSIQLFFGLPRALFCFGIHFNAILGSLSSAMSKLTNSKQTFLTKEFSARRNSGKARR